MAETKTIFIAKDDNGHINMFITKPVKTAGVWQLVKNIDDIETNPVAHIKNGECHKFELKEIGKVE